MAERFDVLIIGGGIIGSSIAMALSRKKAGRIGVIDVDLEGRWSSTERNAGGVRATWWNEVNILLSKESILFYETIAEEVGFRQSGYLWLYGKETWEGAKKMRLLQEKLGWEVQELSPREVQMKVPEIDNLVGIYGATFSPRDGLINPNLLKRYYRKVARTGGVEFLDRMYVKKILRERGRITGVEACVVPEDEGVVEDLLSHPDQGGDFPSVTVSCDFLINAAGAWAPHIASLYGKKVPAHPVRREIALLHSGEVDLSRYGMIVDTSGLYCHPEGGNIVAGYSDPAEPAGFNFRSEGFDFFLAQIWPRLSSRISRCERLRYVSGWAGLYEVSHDRSAIIGRVEECENIFEAHSFSGRGVMQSYAAGEAVADLIAHGHSVAVDVSPLSGERFARGREVCEELHI